MTRCASGPKSFHISLWAELAERRQTMPPRDLAAVLEKRGFVFNGSGNKAVADALRWEVRKGRVVKPARGRFRIGAGGIGRLRLMRQLDLLNDSAEG